MKRNMKKPSVVKMILKLLFVLIAGFFWFSMALGMLWMAFEDGTDYYESDAYIINSCDEYYYEREYAELLEYMNLYDAYDEKYDVYWEVMDAYVDLQEYKKWQKVSSEEIQDAREMEELYYNKVTKASKNCAFPQNQRYLDDFVEMLE